MIQWTILKFFTLSERIYSMLNGLYFLGPIYFKGAAEIIVRSYFLKGFSIKKTKIKGGDY